MPDSCLPMKGGPVGNDGNECAVTCPMDCGKDMMNCPGFNDANGCKMPDTCMPTKGPIGTDGTECAVTCPSAPCGEDFMTCADVSANGCPMPDTCIAMKGGAVDNDGNDCPVSCPCPADHMVCPVDDGNGCSLPICMPTKGPMGKDGNQCANVCPTKCGDNENSCWGGEDANGCPMPDTCIPVPTGAAGECATYCPMNCMAGTVKCPGLADANGCPMPDTCAPTAEECPTNTF